MKTKVITSMALALAALCPIVSGVVFQQDFEAPAFTLGNLQGQGGWTQNRLDTAAEDGSGLREIVSTSSVPVTGATGTQFARLMTPSIESSVEVGASVLFANSLNPMVSNFSFSGKIGYSPELSHSSSGSALALLQLNSSGANAFNGIFFGFRGRLNDVDFVVRNGNDFESVFTAASADAFYSFEVSVNLSGGNTWSISIFDHQGNNVGNVANLAIRGELTSFDAIRSSIGGARKDDAALYFDNLVVIPESGTLAWITGLGAVIIVAITRRKHTRFPLV